MQSAQGEFIPCRALLDFGSQVSIIRSDFANALGLKRHYCSVSLSGIGGSTTKVNNNFVVINFRSKNSADFIFSVSAVLLKTPTAYVSNRLGVSDNIRFSDDGFSHMSQIDIIFGCDILGEIVQGEKITIRSGGPFALNTIFDYSVFGPTNSFSDTSSVNQVGLVDIQPNNYNSCVTLVEAIERFWRSEEPPSEIIKDPLDVECENFFVGTTTRGSDGKYTVRLPLLPTRDGLGNSMQLALRRFRALEKRFDTQPVLRQKYIDFIREYIKLGHMQRSSFDASSGEEHYFLPHHGVFKSSDDTNKIRVVFNGSEPTTNGVSLNDCLYAGEKLQNDITKIILHFRFPFFVFTTDVRMMFRQTWIHPDDRRFQLVLWRERKDEPIEVYELTTNTYGLKSSPFIAIRCLHQLADDEGYKFPKAANILRYTSYVDDLNGGADTIEEAIEIRNELLALMQTAGYELRKWSSNDPRILKDLPEDHCELPRNFDNEDRFGCIKVLGIQWDPHTDSFTYRINIPQQKHVTRRTILSSLSKLFDPLGWICPVVFQAKLLLQSLLSLSDKKVEWDASAPPDLVDKWREFLSDLPNLTRISLPRCVKPKDACTFSLHGFCDGSSAGYGANVYLRSCNELGDVSIQLLIAKSRVAPLKSRLTIPQLELNGAVLLVTLLIQVYNTFVNELSINIDETVCWCDSTIVLAWLRTPPHKLEVFQGNRVSKIINAKINLKWNHVPSDLNCADSASRGISAAEIVHHPLWWRPNWLLESSDKWPTRAIYIPLNLLPGVKSRLVVNVSATQQFDLAEKYSSFQKLVNVMGFIIRYIHNSKGFQPRFTGYLSVIERRQAISSLIRLEQQKYFGDEINALNKNSKIIGSLRKLNLFLDKNGLIRVGGRIRYSDLPFNAKHPLLLPGKGKFVELLVRYSHETYCHVGANSLAAILSRNYWILSVRRLTRSIAFKCVQCFRARPRSDQPFMSDLPPDRVQCARPFQGVGTDFAGPFFIKSSALRYARILKCYLCIFVCLVTKAVHLEVVSELSVEAFVATFSRFVSRRGLPTLVRSDCGTNYTGTDKYLKELYVYLRENNTDIGRELTKLNILWLFNPPSSPNMGGLFEAAVKSAKTHMRRVLGTQSLTFEQLTTFFTKVEAVMNSRPLTAMSTDPNDLEALTPGHFLIGQPLLALPEYNFEQITVSRLSRFQLLQRLSQHFWSRWRDEYLHTLQQRSKWTTHTRAPNVDDLVLIKEDNTPSLEWKRGRIVKLLPGRDSIVRVAEVRTLKGTILRPVSKLCPLPLSH